MQVTPERMSGWWISPALPTVANCLLAALWAFSTAGGWGEAAFCADAGALGGECADAVRTAILFSVPPAALAAMIVLTSWALPRVRRHPARLDALLTCAAALWILAEGIVFVGGYIAKP
ncbi:hypothetical protein [Spirillospora sp. NPDC029432]|uniref:hypothetical protein n=1 Tax=Spirillospora sp. NPDC029432 TaxID=3154599 RepID=UPI003452E31C